MAGRVLVVDDDPDIRELVVGVLEDAGYEVAAAREGHAGLALAAAHRPDLILLDHNMPGCDGPCFLAGYRAQAGPHAPVVLVTATTSAAQRARAGGADDHLGKPFALDALLAVVARHVS